MSEMSKRYREKYKYIIIKFLEILKYVSEKHYISPKMREKHENEYEVPRNRFKNCDLQRKV